MNSRAGLAVLVGRDLPGGEPAIGVAEEIGLAGPRLAGIVGGQVANNDDSLRHGHRAGGRPRPVPIRSVAGGAGRGLTARRSGT